jgi:hypothetical protein
MVFRIVVKAPVFSAGVPGVDIRAPSPRSEFMLRSTRSVRLEAR